MDQVVQNLEEMYQWISLREYEHIRKYLKSSQVEHLAKPTFS